MDGSASNLSPVWLADLDHQSERLEEERSSGSTFRTTVMAAPGSQPLQQQQQPGLGMRSMVRLPPELDRLCFVPPRQTDGAATGAESTADGSGIARQRGDGGADLGDTLASDDADDEVLTDALAQVAELDELLARQVECERYARFHRLLHAHENGIPLSEKELAELQRLRSHVSLSDPELTSNVFKTQVAATLSKPSESDPSEPNQDASFSATGLGDLLEREIRAEAQATTDDGDTPNFIQRNIERVAEMASGVQLTESEQARLAELLAEDSDDDEDEDEADNGIDDMVHTAQTESVAGAEAQDGAIMKVESEIQLAKQAANSHMDSEINRILNRPVQRNPYKLTASQQQRLQMIDSHLQHLSASALLPASALASGATVSSVSLESDTSLSQTASSLPGLAANSALASGDEGQATPSPRRLTADQLELLLEQCRQEQALQPSQALSDVRHSLPIADTLLLEECESEPEASLARHSD